MVSCGALIDVVVVPVQRTGRLGAPVGQLGSPPPVAVALFVTDRPLRAGVGVTGTTKLTGEPVARPAAMVQVTTWPATLQPAGTMPMVRPVGMVSLTVVAAVVAAVPVLVTCKV